jgi:hypothetical protein
MVREPIAAVPAANAAILPLPQEAVEAVKVELEAQFAMVVSQVPPVATLVVLLSQN